MNGKGAPSVGGLRRRWVAAGWVGGPQEVPSSCSHLFLNLGRCISPHPRARLAERSEERFFGVESGVCSFLWRVGNWVSVRLAVWTGAGRGSFSRHSFSLRILVRSHSLLLWPRTFWFRTVAPWDLLRTSSIASAPHPWVALAQRPGRPLKAELDPECHPSSFLPPSFSFCLSLSSLYATL